MDVATFRERSKDFPKADPGVVQGMLDAAALELDPSVWGKFYDEGVFWLTLMKLSKLQVSAATRKDGEMSSYEKEFERLQLQVTAGACLVSGGGRGPLTCG